MVMTAIGAIGAAASAASAIKNMTSGGGGGGGGQQQQAPQASVQGPRSAVNLDELMQNLMAQQGQLSPAGQIGGAAQNLAMKPGLLGI